ncbi:hypothetical protein PCASD_24263 [Puccinia coronata f. sp. avenae]|uniref:No apical meristem-associated C-terminal domain-containing protein n=1 Tax=Puccinia coronata f. sp. avenae TaxID=200324 RepID=A0A2N5S9U7_9BASI|nr:hypothetical protein PCASD_24263 [Puccinia coronata f. sp. avenae]
MPSKRGANWLPQDDEQLAKTDDYNDFSSGVERDGTSVIWGHIQKATLKFSAIYHKLEHNRPSGLVMADLLPNTKKVYYKQEGKQFIHEQAWMVIKDLPKWAPPSQTQAHDTQDSQSPAFPSTQAANTQTNAANANPDDVASTAGNRGTSWKRPPGFHTTKRLLKQEDFNSKKIKMLNERSKNYCKRTLAMNQTNDIRHEVAKVKVHASNLEIMAKDPDDLPNDISQEFLKLQKEEILEDLQERLKAKKKRTQEKDTANSNKEAEVLSSSYFDSEPASFDANGQSSNNQDPSSQANMQDYCNNDEHGTSEGHNLDPSLDSLLM